MGLCGIGLEFPDGISAAKSDAGPKNLPKLPALQCPGGILLLRRHVEEGVSDMCSEAGSALCLKRVWCGKTEWTWVKLYTWVRASLVWNHHLPIAFRDCCNTGQMRQGLMQLPKSQAMLLLWSLGWSHRMCHRTNRVVRQRRPSPKLRRPKQQVHWDLQRTQVLGTVTTKVYSKVIFYSPRLVNKFKLRGHGPGMGQRIPKVDRPALFLRRLRLAYMQSPRQGQHRNWIHWRSHGAVQKAKNVIFTGRFDMFWPQSWIWPQMHSCSCKWSTWSGRFWRTKRSLWRCGNTKLTTKIARLHSFQIFQQEKSPSWVVFSTAESKGWRWIQLPGPSRSQQKGQEGLRDGFEEAPDWRDLCQSQRGAVKADRFCWRSWYQVTKEKQMVDVTDKNHCCTRQCNDQQYDPTQCMQNMYIISRT